MTAASSLVEIKFADGQAIASWESFTLRESYSDPIGSYQFTFAPPAHKLDSYIQRTRKGESLKVSIDGKPQASCLITTQEGEIGEDGVTLAIEAKSPLATPFEGSVDPYFAKTLKEDTSIRDIVLEVMRPYGLAALETDASADVAAISGKALNGRKGPVLLDELKLKDVQADQNETAYGFCSRLFTRLGLALRVTSAGHLILSAPDYQQAAAYSVVAHRDPTVPGDRMLKSPPIRWRDTNDGQFSEIIVGGKTPDKRGTTSASEPISGVQVKGIERPFQQGGGSLPFPHVKLLELPEGRHNYRGPWKPNYRTDRKSRDVSRCRNFAKLLHGVRSANAFQVHCAVDGFRSKSGNRLWAIDTVGRVIVEDALINEDMWLYERTFSCDRRGEIAMLTWIPLNGMLIGEAS